MSTGARGGVLALLTALGGCALGTAVAPPAQESAASYLFVWAGDPDPGDSDFLAVIDAMPDSDSFGEVLATAPVGRSAGAHHTEHVMPAGGHLFANGFTAGQSWVFDLADPLHPLVEATFMGAGDYTSPHSFVRTPEGNVLSTFQYKHDDPDVAGGLVELDPMGNFLRGSDAADPVDPELRPYSLDIDPTIDRVVSTTSDMNERYEGSSVQIWRLSDLKLLRTLPLPPGPRGDEHLNPAEPRFLADGRALVNTFDCGLYLLEGIAGDAPTAELVGSLPRDGRDECSLPVVYDHYWVQTAETSRSLVVFDIADPRRPVQVDELVLGGESLPHWISLEPGSNRIVLTGYGDLAGMVVLLEIDPANGALSVVDGFGAAGDLGVSMRRSSWPHGDSGPAIPHGAVFSR